MTTTASNICQFCFNILTGKINAPVSLFLFHQKKQTLCCILLGMYFSHMIHKHLYIYKKNNICVLLSTYNADRHVFPQRTVQKVLTFGNIIRRKFLLFREYLSQIRAKFYNIFGCKYVRGLWINICFWYPLGCPREWLFTLVKIHIYVSTFNFV